MLSEVCIAQDGATAAGRLIKGGSSTAWDAVGNGYVNPDMGTGITSVQRATNVVACSMTKTGNTVNVAGDGGMNYALGRRWSDAGIVWSGFSTVLPPNSPSCGGSSQELVVSASSYHTGGVVTGWGDGSVSFTSESIDCGSYATITDLPGSGKSPFGVWGAMGSANGGEPVRP